MKNNSNMAQNYRCGGYILLVALLAVMIIGLIFTYRIYMGHAINMDTGREDENPPWRQWQNMEKHLASGKLEKPSSQQLSITEVIELNAPLYEEQNERGAITLTFNPDCTINGTWGGTFFIDPNQTTEHNVISSRVKGYLVPDGTCVKVENKDGVGKTYFLSKGFFAIAEYNSKTSRARTVSGEIYVTGWLASDYTVQQGQVVITSDEKNFKSFTFSGKAEKMNKNFDLRLKSLQKG